MWWFVTYGITAAPVHIRSEDNEIADALTRTDELSAQGLLEILRRWVNSHPDTTGWAVQSPVRPDLLQYMQRCDFDAPGRPHLGLHATFDARFAFV